MNYDSMSFEETYFSLQDIFSRNVQEWKFKMGQFECNSDIRKHTFISHSQTAVTFCMLNFKNETVHILVELISTLAL